MEDTLLTEQSCKPVPASKRGLVNLAVCGAALVISCFAAGIASADPLGDSNDILCAVLETHVCVEAGTCAQAQAEDLNIPRFLLVDLRARKLSTTEASGENRSTVVESVNRSGEQVTLQGVEAGRAFSLFIDTASGFATFASAAAGRSATVFGVCTPAP